MESYFDGLLVRIFVTVFLSLIAKHMYDKSEKTPITIRRKKDKLEQMASLFAWPIEGRPSLLVEELFKDYLGKRFRYSEIIAVLEKRNPMYIFDILKDSKIYLEFNEGTKRYVYKEKYRTEKLRRRFKLMNNAFYFVVTPMILFPVIYSPLLITTFGLGALTTIVVFVVFGLPFAFGGVLENFRLDNAAIVLDEFEIVAKQHE